MGSTAPSSGTNPQNSVFAHLPDAGVQTAYGTTAPFGAIDPARWRRRAAPSRTTTCSRTAAVSFIISLYGIYPQPN